MDVTPPSLRFVRPGPSPADEELLLEHDCYRRATEGASLCLTNEDAMAIAAQLRSTPCTGVLQIDLSRNRITQTGAAALALAIGESHAQSLEELDLSHNRIGPLGMATLGAVLATGALPTGSPPARLQLRGMVCTGGTLGALKDIHPKAGYCTVELFGGATTYAKTSSLLGAQVPEQWSTSLRVLNLSACHIGVQGARAAAAALRSMPALASLDLSANAICNRHKDSEGFWVGRYEPEGIAAISRALGRNKNTQLAALSLSGNAIEDEEVCEFCRQGSKCLPAMARLDLSRNQIRNLHATGIESAICNHMRLLTSLNVQGNYVSYATIEDLESAFKASLLVGLTLVY